MTDEAAGRLDGHGTGAAIPGPPPRGGGTAVEVLPSLYDFILWMAPKLAKYPKVHRFTLGDRIMTLLLEILDGVIVARYQRRDRVSALNRVNVGLERLRYLVRLSKDLNCLSLKEYEHAARQLVDTGQRIGGWLKHARRIREGG